MGIGPQSLSYGFLNEIMDNPCSEWVLEVIRSNVSNLMKDVPNFMKDVPRVPKCDLKWGSDPNHFVMGFQMKL